MKITNPAFLLSLTLLLSTIPSSTSIEVINSLSQLPYDENDHLSTHIFAYTSSGCNEIDHDPAAKDGMLGHTFIKLEGQAAEDVFGHLPKQQIATTTDYNNDNNEDGEEQRNNDCKAVCLEKGTPKQVIARPLPHRYWRNGVVDQDGDGKRVEEMERAVDFLYSDGCGRVEYGFVNYHDSVSWFVLSGCLTLIYLFVVEGRA